MRQRRDADLWEKLESMAREWCGTDPENASARKRLNTAISEILMELFCHSEAMEALGIFWERDMGKYDPQMGSFRSFATSRLKLRKKDMEKEDFGFRRETDGESGEKKWVRNASLDTPAGDDGEGTLADQQAAPEGDGGQESLEAESTVQQLLTLILQLPERLTGQAKNPARVNYYRMFFTDGTVAALHAVGAQPYRTHERDLFRAMKLPFLDFFMERPCRTVPTIMETDLKRYGEIVEGRPMEHPGQPLPNDVYVTYLGNAEGLEVKSPSTITNQRTAYRAFLKENLC
ncbi:MAG: hypothetical protein EGR51_00125 [Oscillibacter sp.]|nr:hypothetical protein [Oscillibacter sp.]